MAVARVNLTVEPTPAHHIESKVELQIPLLCCCVNDIVVGVGVGVVLVGAPSSCWRVRRS